MYICQRLKGRRLLDSQTDAAGLSGSDKPLVALGDRQEVNFREMQRADLLEVVRVENSCYDFPWSEKIFTDCHNAGYLCFVIEQNPIAESERDQPAFSGRLYGHGILMLGPGEAHILNICVEQSMRRLGVARLLLQHLIETARQHEAKEVFLEVRESNSAAMRLYESEGFNQIAVRSRYYNSNATVSGREDALLYALTVC